MRIQTFLTAAAVNLERLAAAPLQLLRRWIGAALTPSRGDRVRQFAIRLDARFCLPALRAVS